MGSAISARASGMSTSTAPALTLDERHIYRIGERVIPSVTQIINAVVRPQYFGATEWHIDRGTALHAAIKLDTDGTLDESSLDPAIEGRFRAYRQFLAENHAEIIESEVMLSSRRYGFAGTVDAFMGYAIGKAGIVDWKGSLSPSSDLQIAAYNLLAKEHGINNMDDDYHCAVELHDDGSYRTRFITDIRRAERVFLSMLTSYNWMASNGYLPKGEN